MAEVLSSKIMEENIAHIRLRIAQAAKASGRLPQEIFLCAASKSRTSQTIKESAMHQVDMFGENRMQEMVANFDAGAYLGKPCHFIGHLQTNKVKKIVGLADVIQSVDSLRLLEVIDREASVQNLCQDILFQVNLGDEPGKDGASKKDLWQMLEAAAGLRNVRVKGLMAIPPVTDNITESRWYFAMLRELLERAKTYRYENAPMDTLSMGMTDSFEAAILEGATIIRVGTGIYGPRQ
ncbi:MAG: YggS family pyridoxal phosphate-dependent enzyme [Clostridiales bacterium]|nr:YggS family pyridoxal phosphate-dependent enzyme [Clostridiales bacterium]